MPKRISIKGFKRATRAVGINNTQDKDKYFMMYEVEDKKVLSSNDYLRKLNSLTQLTKKVLSTYIYFSRSICEVISSISLTYGISGYFGTIRILSNNFDIKNKFNFSIKNLKSKKIIGIHKFKADKNISKLNTKEKLIRATQGKEDKIINCAILIEG